MKLHLPLAQPRKPFDLYLVCKVKTRTSKEMKVKMD